MDALNVDGLWQPPTSLKQPKDIRPCSVEQGKGMVEGQGSGGVRFKRMNR
jgi:hypothetical protein